MKLLLALLIATSAAAEGQPAFDWVDAQCTVILKTWDDEFRVPKSGGAYDACWYSDDQTVTCESGSIHQIAEGGNTNTLIWDGVKLRRKGLNCPE